ncbi:NUDIX hydrolase [Paradevosia shaoguanensis]|uniref:NUDIX hydrolase n=1 Tax=Paradevosia shaoguanensis TaxID=1335043 RepID=A0AA41QR88_9HYPH|nr:NUDIX hydrolase [Paradevosia shaoguanensis]MCF1744046.1 NUDIX hydrolase [Paradevosia shaoguanensis]MCI0128529.1 NUDIX hydrolase [Paradevosia shaoguanensis]CDP50652.1 Hydrolase, NUDIX family [Devosia sp. DBB001]
MAASEPIRQHAQQVAALPWRRCAGGEIEILLITSRTSRRWLIPKGWPIAGKSAAEAALQEAFEEAGVRGEANVVPFGSYRYEKLLKDGTLLPCQVTVYAMDVRQELDDWPELEERERRWLSLAEAAGMIHEPHLQRLLRETTGEMLRATARPVEAVR